MEGRESHQDASRGLDGAEFAKIFSREEVISRRQVFEDGADLERGEELLVLAVAGAVEGRDQFGLAHGLHAVFLDFFLFHCFAVFLYPMQR